MPHHLLFRLAGLAGIAAALCWIAGDVLLVGRSNPAALAGFPADAPIDADLAARLLSSSPRQLAWGALLGALSGPLYLAGSWHLWQLVRSAGRGAWIACGLLMAGNVLAPLAHAAFYFVGLAGQAAMTDPAAEAGWQLVSHFHHMLLWAYVPAVACLGAGTLGWSLALAHRASLLPGWCALTCNPLIWLLALHLAQRAMPAALAIATEAATFNLIMLAIFAQTTALAWKTGRPTAP